MAVPVCMCCCRSTGSRFSHTGSRSLFPFRSTGRDSRILVAGQLVADSRILVAGPFLLFVVSAVTSCNVVSSVREKKNNAN
jgi:hypothetical protein